jgi:hypothetical protein
VTNFFEWVSIGIHLVVCITHTILLDPDTE